MVWCRRWPRSLRKDNVSAPNTPRDSHAYFFLTTPVGKRALQAKPLGLSLGLGLELGLN